MANSIHIDKQGPVWPLGNIAVSVAGTPVGIMSLVDPGNVNASGAPTSQTSDEYTSTCNQIVIQGFKGSAPMVPNTGNVYLVRKGVGAGTGNRADQGAIVLIIPSGQTGVFGSSSLVKNAFSPYHFSLDADNAGDAGQVTLLIF
jgi:hypothetical protein